MTTGRRELLQMMAGAALYAATNHINGFATEPGKAIGKRADAIPLVTDVILNGTFGLVFSKSGLTYFSPKVDDHQYRLDNYDLGKMGVSSLNLNVAGSAPGTRTAGSYDDLLGFYYSPNDDKFYYNKNVIPKVQLTLPFPTQIYPHRLLGISINRIATIPAAIAINGRAGALVLRYEVTSGAPFAPTVDEIRNYKASIVNNHYQILVTASATTNMSSDEHARMAWTALAQHFVDDSGVAMRWQLQFAGDSDLKPTKAVDPEGISDDDIEKHSVPLSIQQYVLELKRFDQARKVRPDDRRLGRDIIDAMATAANCKTFGFITKAEEG
ncbi:MAG TPA: hypothetical protein VII23_16220 [Terriglobales bacterium]